MEETDLVDNSNFIKKKEKNKEQYNNFLNEIKALNEGLFEANTKNDEKMKRYYTKKIMSKMQVLSFTKGILDFMRPDTEEDTFTRQKILFEFPKTVKRVIPNTVPLVFHGNSNIGIVMQIIESGGLFTPEERGVDYSSFATQIDVAYKDEITVPCEFAEKLNNNYMPYGAIFTFFPKEKEYEDVLNTGDSTEVFGGVEGINFKTDAERLYAIISTEENIDKLKTKCKESGINPEKVVSHEEFINLCQTKFGDLNKEELSVKPRSIKR